VQDFIPLVGVLVGGFLSTATAMLLYRRQRRDAKETERHARETAATARIGDVVASLIVLDRRPDELREIEEDRRYRHDQSLDDLPPEPEEAALDAWDRRRAELLLALETAGMDLSSEALRFRLERAQRALRYPAGPWDIGRQPESVTRRIVCRHVLECVGAFRRGDPLPPEPQQFTGTIGDVDQWIEWQEEQDRYQREEWAKQRAARKSSSPSTPPT
jgi:hypothetical protein